MDPLKPPHCIKKKKNNSGGEAGFGQAPALLLPSYLACWSGPSATSSSECPWDLSPFDHIPVCPTAYSSTRIEYSILFVPQSLLILLEFHMLNQLAPTAT